MKRYLTAWIQIGLAVFGFAALSLAQTPPADFSGIWTIEGMRGLGATAGAENTARDLAAGRLPQFGFTIGEPPMQPWAIERYKLDRLGTQPSDGGNDTIDPVMWPYCLPEGLTRSYTITPFEIVQTPEIIYMLFERNHETRRIYLDGEKHLEGYIPSFMGTAVGRWDGTTLVVDTDNFEGLEGYNKLDTFGHPMTDQLRVHERISRPEQDTLRIEVTIDDPGAYTKPWGGTKIFKLRSDWDMTEEIICRNYQREGYIRDMKNNTPRGTP